MKMNTGAEAAAMPINIGIAEKNDRKLRQACPGCWPIPTRCI